jgi:adenosine deaminase
MFDTSLVEEYHGLMNALGLTRDDVRALILGAVDASWLPGDRRRSMAETFRSHPAWGAERPPHAERRSRA